MAHEKPVLFALLCLPFNQPENHSWQLTHYSPIHGFPKYLEVTVFQVLCCVLGIQKWVKPVKLLPPGGLTAYGDIRDQAQNPMLIHKL